MAYVYRHITKNKDISEVFYIGIGSDLNNKYKRAFETRRRSNFWKNIYNKYDFNVEIILDDLTWEQACNKEIEFIKLYGRRDLGLGTLCNLTNGGDGVIGLIWTKDHRDKLSKSLKGRVYSNETINKMSAAQKGKKGIPHTEEFKNKMREIQTGRKASEESKRKNSERQKGKKVSDETKKKQSEARKGKTRSLETKKKMSNSMKVLNARSKKVLQISTGIIFNSIKQASEVLNIPNHYLKNFF
jgi:hypothetical protein